MQAATRPAIGRPNPMRQAMTLDLIPLPRSDTDEEASASKEMDDLRSAFVDPSSSSSMSRIASTSLRFLPKRLKRSNR